MSKDTQIDKLIQSYEIEKHKMDDSTNFIKPARSAGFSRIKKIPYPPELGCDQLTISVCCRMIRLPSSLDNMALHICSYRLLIK